jgi:S1-C subfamily serine protease
VDGLLVVRVKESLRRPTRGHPGGRHHHAVNGQKVSTADQFGKLVANAKKGDYLKLYVFSPRANLSRFALVHID